MEYGVLRLIHLAAGIVLGGGMAMGWFVIPAALEAGPAGGAVLRGIAERRFPQFMMAAGALVILTGLRLFMLRLTPGWLTTPSGLAISLGALLGIGAFVMNVAVQRPLSMKMAAIGARAAAEKRPPTPEEQQELAALGARLRRIGAIGAAHVAAAAVLMSALRLTDSL